MKRQFTLLAILILTPMTSSLAQKRAFTIEDLYRIKSISDVRVSPDGKTILYAVTTADLPRAKRVTHIWVMDIDGRNARQLTQGERSSFSPLWSPDGKRIAFISSKDGNTNLYVMSETGGDVRKVTNISTDVYDPVFSPDGKSVAFSTDVYPQCGDNDNCNQKIAKTWQDGPLRAHMADSLLYRVWSAWKDGTRTHIFLSDISSGAMRDLTPGDFDSPPFQLGEPLQYDFSPDGNEFVYASNRDRQPATSTNSDLHLLSLSDKPTPPRNITESNPAYDGSSKYSPDGRFIAYRMQKQPGYESDLFRLALYDRASRTSTVLTESFRNSIEDFEWSDDSKAIYFSAPAEGERPVYQLDLGTRKIKLVVADGNILGFDLAPKSNRLIYFRSSVSEPAEIFSTSISEGNAETPTRLTNINQSLGNEVDIRGAEKMWVETASGRRIQVFIVKPHGFEPQKKYPLILNVHGGPQLQWSDSFRGDWQVYPGAGYVVAFPNPTGSIGFGQDLTAAVSGDWAGKAYEDLMVVTDALEKLPYVDANRMGAMGWSYGGYMMNWFEGHTHRFKALASMMGIYDLRSFYGATDELWFPEWEMKGQPWDSGLYEKWSPSTYVKNFSTPCLLIAGERDYRIPYTQSLQMFTALQKMNVPSRLIIYQNSGHWPSWYEMALYYTAHLEWFHNYLGGGAPPWTTEEFLRNAVFDRATGRRLVNGARAASMSATGAEEKAELCGLCRRNRNEP